MAAAEIADEGAPAQVIKQPGLKVGSNDGELIAAIDAVVAQQSDVLEKVCDRKNHVDGSVIGAPMEST